MHIVGAGLAGLLAGNMLRHREPILYEAQPALPNNHSAVLRFRTPIVGDVLNQPFKKVMMIKTHLPWKNPVADALQYSFKNNGSYRSDRSIITGPLTAERWIAPPDFIKQASYFLQVRYNYNYPFFNGAEKKSLIPIISTIPMPALMKSLNYPHQFEFKFNSTPGVTIKATIENCVAYVSLLIPDPKFLFTRISITGNELIIEQPQTEVASSLTYAKLCVGVAAEMLGINEKFCKDITIYQQRYAKIDPVDDNKRKAFMFWATDRHNIYSLGRFATWRPSLLLDDLVQDLRLIDRWISNGQYAVAQHR